MRIRKQLADQGDLSGRETWNQGCRFLATVILGSATAVVMSCLERDCDTFLKYRKFANFPLTRAASLLLYESREKAGPVPSAESVFFSGPASQFSAVDDC